MPTIQNIVQSVQGSPDVKQGRIPVIFNGREPRMIGYAVTHEEADALAILNRVSATYNSRATCKLADGTVSLPFFVLHG